MVWGTIIALYLFLAGVSAGAFLMSSYVSRKYPKAHIVRKTGRFISPVVMAIGLLLLILDAEAGLKHPFRFIYLLTNFKSVMTIGTYFIGMFMMVGMYFAVMEYMKKEANKMIEYVGIFLAIGTAMYTGFLIGIVHSVPLWNTTILPFLFVVSALSAGIAATILASSIINRQEVSQMIAVKKIHLILLFAEILLLFTMLLITSSTNEVAASSVALLLTGKYTWLFWIGLVIIGLVIPIVLESLEIFQHGKIHKTKAGLEMAASGAPRILSTLMTEGSVLIGGFLLRYLLLAAAIPVAFL